eukprot:Colp12_sorted_trinity150504_noHs@5684
MNRKQEEYFDTMKQTDIQSSWFANMGSESAFSLAARKDSSAMQYAGAQFSQLNGRASISSSGSENDDGESNSTGEKSLRCETCGKVYKQRNSLHKHMWEHSVYWEPTSKMYNMNKHQQVQAMQAAMELLAFANGSNNAWRNQYPEVRF